MKLEYMQEFLVLSDTLNFSSAAKTLFISQPTLTRHIQAIEEELGVSLVTSTSHSVALTSHGEATVKSFRKIIQEYNSLNARFDLEASRLHGQLTIGLLYYAIDDYFSEFLDNFQKKYPGIQLQFRSYVPQQLLDDLRQHKVDIATLFYYDKSALADLRCVPITKTSMVVMLHKDNPLNKQEQISLSDLVDYPLIELLNDAYSNEMTRQYLSKSGITFSKFCQADNIEMVPVTIRRTGGIHITGESCQRQCAFSIVYRTLTDKLPPALLAFCASSESTNPLADLFLNNAQLYFRHSYRENSL